MARQPTPGGDEGAWGAVLNDYLSVSLDTNGSLKTTAVPDASATVKGKVQLTGDLAGTADSPTVPGLAAKAPLSSPTFSGTVTVPTPVGPTDAATKGYVDGVTVSGAPDASAGTKGIVQLTGDLGGTATAPTVPGLASKEPTITAGTASQYYRGDKSFQTLDKTVVGLSNVDNTSDANKPISTAAQTALNLKAPLASPTFTGTVTVPTPSNPTDATNKSYVDTAVSGLGIPFATISLPGTLATGAISLPFPINGTWLFEALIVDIGATPTGASVIVDLLYNGTTIYTTTANRPTIAPGSVWAAGGAPNTTTFTGSTSVRGYLQFSVAQVGSAGTEGADLVATLYASRIG